MRSSHSDMIGDARVRLVFNGAVKSFKLASDATFGDLALKLGDATFRPYGKPLGIAVALPAGARH